MNNIKKLLRRENLQKLTGSDVSKGRNDSHRTTTNPEVTKALYFE